MHKSPRIWLQLTAMLSLCAAQNVYPQLLPPSALKVLYHFGGANIPAGELVQGPDGSLFGVSPDAGAFNEGSVFKLSPTGQFQTLHSFSTATAFQDGAHPAASLIFGSDGHLYGTTPFAGPNGSGSVFRMTVAGAITTLAGFVGGMNPTSPLHLGADGNFYGVGGGPVGKIFRMTPTGTLTTLHDLAADGSEGAGATGSLLRTADGSIYGTTSLLGRDPAVGTTGTGTIFRISPSAVFSVLQYFPYTATNRISGLVVGPDGRLYGTIQLGQPIAGNVFAITTSGTYSNLFSFGGTAFGSQPIGPLVQGYDGNLYGVTTFGGSANSGTIFKLTAGGAVIPLHDFVAGDGGAPVGGLIRGLDDRFYGMTSGLLTGDATIYSFALPPPMPLITSVTAGDGTANLTWAAVKSANSYNVYTGTSAGAEGNTPILSGLTATTAAVTGLQNGVTHYFVVVAVNEAGNGVPSVETSALPVAAPSNLVAAPGNNSVTLTWSAAAGATSYNVYMGLAANAQGNTSIASGLTSTSYVVNGLTNGTQSFFKVASVNGSTVIQSVEVSATPTAPAASGSGGSSGSNSGNTNSGGGGGGGSMGNGLLALLTLLALRRLTNQKASSS